MQTRDSLLTLREQRVTSREHQLDTLEWELRARERIVDSLQHATGPGVIDSSLLGEWNASMECTQTSCDGSAVGDIRIESWTISYKGDTVIIHAHQKDTLARIYTGRYDGSTLTAKWSSGDTAAARMTVELGRKGPNAMEGTRVIDHLTESCQVIYSLILNRP